jgi:peptidyl-prolyl cis-trans isomerase B (cyclophilin B)
VAKPKKPGTGATNRRRRALAAAKSDRQSARRAEREAARHRRNRIIGSLVGLAAVAVIAGVVLWPDSGAESPEAAASAAPEASAAASPASTIKPADIGCTEAPVAQATPKPVASPAMTIDKATNYQLKLATNCGDITISTLTAKAPQTVNGMLGLARAGYFDATPCHRLTTSGLFVLQCGDPTGTGSGGPGFTLPDENLPADKDGNYPKGTVAMANSGANTAGSQFFIVYKDTTLPPGYTIWGTVTDGLDVVTKVARAGSANGDGAPNVGVGIESATVVPPLG